MTAQPLITGDCINIKGLILVGMCLFLYYLVIVGCTLLNLPRIAS
jgi:hypothetical protein